MGSSYRPVSLAFRALRVLQFLSEMRTSIILSRVFIEPPPIPTRMAAPRRRCQATERPVVAGTCPTIRSDPAIGATLPGLAAQPVLLTRSRQ
jgi:hypothetical protein